MLISISESTALWIQPVTICNQICLGLEPPQSTCPPQEAQLRPLPSRYRVRFSVGVLGRIPAFAQSLALGASSTHHLALPTVCCLPRSCSSRNSHSLNLHPKLSTQLSLCISVTLWHQPKWNQLGLFWAWGLRFLCLCSCFPSSLCLAT